MGTSNSRAYILSETSKRFVEGCEIVIRLRFFFFLTCMLEGNGTIQFSSILVSYCMNSDAQACWSLSMPVGGDVGISIRKQQTTLWPVGRPLSKPVRGWSLVFGLWGCPTSTQNCMISFPEHLELRSFPASRRDRDHWLTTPRYLFWWKNSAVLYNARMHYSLSADIVYQPWMACLQNPG